MSEHGLLRTASDTCYGELESWKEEWEFLSKSGVFWDAAERDGSKEDTAVRVSAISDAMLAYRRSDLVADRSTLRDEIKHAAARRNLQILVGGKSIGKTTVLKSTISELNDNDTVIVLYVDGRLHQQNFALGIKEAFESLPKKFEITSEEWGQLGAATFSAFSAFTKSVVPVATGATAKIALAGVSCGASLFAWLMDQEERDLKYIDLFLKYATKLGRIPFLVIDEANEMIVVADGQATADPLLAKLVAYTKQASAMSVLLASSDHSYSYKLSASGLQCENTKVIFADELPPKEMKTLLMGPQIKMGVNLANVCITVFGGHFYKVENAITELLRERANFEAWDEAQKAGQNISFESVFKKKEGIDVTILVKILKALATKGNASASSGEESCMDVITQHGIGSRVSRPEARKRGSLEKSGDFYLVPSSQVLRFTIFQQLDSRGHL